MATSSSTLSLAPSLLSAKFIPYVHSAPKPNPKSKAKPKAKTKTTENNLFEAGSFKDREWFDIDNFPMPYSNASRSLDLGVPALFGAVDPSGSLDQDVVGGLGAAPVPEKREHYQSDWESLDGTDHATSVAKTNLATNGLLDGSSLEFPLILEGDAAEEHYSTTHVEPSNGALEY